MYASTTAAVLGTEWALLTVGAVLILARLYLQLRINGQGLSVSDAFLCLAWSSAAACSSFDIVFMRMGILRPDVDVNLAGFHGGEAMLKRALMYFWLRGYTFFATFYLYKAALLAFYVHIIPEIFTAYRIALWATVVYTGIGFAVSVLLNLCLCLPVERNWALDGNGCLEETRNLFNIAWALHFSSDIIIFVFPFYMFHEVRIGRLVRLALYGIFGLGFIAISICLTRYVVLKLPRQSTGFVSFTNIELWTAVDANLGVVIATLPFLRPYLHMIVRSPSGPSSDEPLPRPIIKTGWLAKYGFTGTDIEKTAGESTVAKSVSNKVDDEKTLVHGSATASRDVHGSRSAEGGNEIELTGIQGGGAR